MQRVTWLRTHVAIRNGARGISTSFFEPDYQVTLKDRVFYITKNGVPVTNTGIENVVEFTLGENIEEKAKPSKAKLST